METPQGFWGVCFFRFVCLGSDYGRMVSLNLIMVSSVCGPVPRSASLCFCGKLLSIHSCVFDVVLSMPFFPANFESM